jgi:hypothetical protein
MLSLLKKKSDAAAAPAVPNWHPNFRNFEKLPDTKVVRTAFFVNGASVFLALALGTYFGIKEWQLHGLQVQIGEEQRKIDRDKKPSDRFVALFKKFTAEEARVLEVDTFVKSKPLVSALIMRIGETLPANIAIDSMDLRDQGLILRLSVRGAPETAPGYATAYLDQLRADKSLSQFEEFTFTTTPTLNPSTGRMAVEFLLKVKGPAVAPKKP